MPTQRGDLLVEPGHNILKPGQVRFRRLQLLLCILAAHMQSCDARRFFQHCPALSRLRRDHCGDAALADQSRAVRARCRIGENQRDVLGAHIAPVNAVSAAGSPFNPADDFDFLACAILAPGCFCVQHHFGESAWWAVGRARENHVFHAAAAHGLCRAFAHDPADRFEEV